MSHFTFTIDGPAKAPVLVLANSLSATTDMWVQQVRALRDEYRILRFNYAGHGGENSLAVSNNAASLAHTLLKELNSQAVDEFGFAGLSLGGMLGLQLASIAPDRVKNLLIANCRYFQTPATQAQWTDRIRTVRDNGIQSIADVTIERWFTPAFRASEPEQMQVVRAMICGTSAEGYAAAAQVVRDFDARPLLSRIKCPVMIVSGAQDLAAPQEHLQELSVLLNAHHLALDSCAHLSNIEREREFTTAMTRFLSN